ncbi:hypothetical protein AB0I92_03815 [Micromonospora chalcea]|uniref:hypothetical protein n=1 Tax=Micromonospora chalcea TaxID=1874 RepID=UPI000CE50DD1|nr:hypothetical protein BAW75_12735 [Micromonospora chalcea]
MAPNFFDQYCEFSCKVRVATQPLSQLATQFCFYPCGGSLIIVEPNEAFAGLAEIRSGLMLALVVTAGQ